MLCLSSALDIWGKQSDQTLPRAGILLQGSQQRLIRAAKSHIFASKLNGTINRAGGCILQMCDTFSSPASCFSGNREEVEASWLRSVGRATWPEMRHALRMNRLTVGVIEDFYNSETSKKNMNGRCTAAQTVRQQNAIDVFTTFTAALLSFL